LIESERNPKKENHPLVRLKTMSAAPQRLPRVVVVGSGIAGLSAAYYASKAGQGKVEVELIEKESELGGHSLTGKRKNRKKKT
jgi:NADPH-dependent 2,4-dienoyl-CoA reductase/sulfur reductase-like enzyme